MEMEEGIKFNCRWIKAGMNEDTEELNTWRDRLHDLKLIGAYQNGIGYGNVSMRIGESDAFLITGAGTGGMDSLTKDSYTLVTSCNIEENTIEFKGPIKASSESLSHAMLYSLDGEIKSVLHVHSIEMWKNLFGKVSTTKKGIEYGTPELAMDIKRLFTDGQLRNEKILVMGGHMAGIIAFGSSIGEAGETLLDYFRKSEENKSL